MSEPLPMTDQRKPFALKISSGEALQGDVYVSSGATECPIVIIVHGYTGFKDWGSMPAMCRWFAERGMASIAFNFSHNGIGRDPLSITERDKFAANTVSRELSELHAMVDAASEGTLPCAEQCNRNAVILLGHSRGGAETIIVGRESPRVCAVATWGTVSHFDRWTERQKREWRAAGKRVLHFTRLDTTLEMSVEYLDDLEMNSVRFDVADNVANLNKPLLLVHGAQDVTVHQEESRALYEAANTDRTRLLIIPAAGHTFGASHPFEGMTPALEQALNATSEFVRKVITSV